MPTRTTVLTHFARETPEVVRENLVAFKDLSLNAFYLPPGATLAFQARPDVERLHIVLEGACTIRREGNAFKVERGAAVGMAAPGAHKVEASDRGVALMTAAFRHDGENLEPGREGVAIFDLLGQSAGEASAQVDTWAARKGIGRRAVLLTGLQTPGPLQVHGRAHRVFVVLMGAVSVVTPDETHRVDSLEVLVLPPATPHRVVRRSGETARVLVLSDNEAACDLYHHVSCGAAFSECFLVGARQEGQVVLSGDGTVVSANDAARAWLGLPDSPEGVRLFDCLPGTDAAWLSRLLRQPVSHPPEQRTLNLPAQERGTIRAIGVPYQGHGRTRKLVLTLYPQGLPSRDARPRVPGAPGRDIDAFVAVSPTMLELAAGIRTLAEGDRWAMVVGEPGTGRTTVASLLHHLRYDSRRRFVVMDCDEWPPERVPEALARRSTRDPDTWQAGHWLEQATPGTLLLGHLQRLPAKIQAEVLRRLDIVSAPDSCRVVLELDEKPCRGLPRKRRGKPFPARGRFAWVELPPLRARAADIPALLASFFARHTGGHPPPVLSNGALEVLLDHAYPNNLRDLERLVTTLAAIPIEGPVTEAAVRALLGDRAAQPPRATDELPTLEAGERELVRAALEQAGGNKSEAARRLGIPRARLTRLVARHGLRA